MMNLNGLMVLVEKSFGRKSGFWVKSCFKHFYKISHFGVSWFKLFWVVKLFFWVCINGLRVWEMFSENIIENWSKIGNLREKTQKRKNQNFSVCQSGMTANPCGTVVRVFSWMGGTTVFPVGRVGPAPLCPKTLIFCIFEYF